MQESRKIPEIIATAKRRLDELPGRSKAAMVLASSKGWFFGWNDSLQSLIKLIKKLEMTQLSNVDEIMLEYYRENLQHFTDELMDNHPNRAPIIKAAVMAHRTLGSDGYFYLYQFLSRRLTAC